MSKYQNPNNSFDKPTKKIAWNDQEEIDLGSKTEEEQKKAFPTFAIAEDAKEKSSSILQTLRTASASIAKNLSSLKQRFQAFKFNFGKAFNNRVVPISPADVTLEMKNKQDIAAPTTQSDAKSTSGKIAVKPAREQGLPSYLESLSDPSESVTPQDITELPRYRDIINTSSNKIEERPVSPPPAYDPDQPRLADHEDVKTLGSAPSYLSLDLDEQESVVDDIHESTANTTQSTLATEDAPKNTIISQAEPEPDALDKIFKEYIDLFEAAGKKDGNTYLNKEETAALLDISERLEQDFLSKDATEKDDGSKLKLMNSATSIRLKNFLEKENSPLSIMDRKKIAKTLYINLLDNGKVEYGSNLTESAAPVVAEQPSAPAPEVSKQPKAPQETPKQKEPLDTVIKLFEDVVKAQKDAARTRVKAGEQPVTFRYEKSTTLDEIDNKMKLKPKPAKSPSTSPKTILKEGKPAAQPLDGHTGELTI